MDHLGATLGASAAAVAAWAAPNHLAAFVVLLAVPGILQVVLLGRLRDVPRAEPKPRAPIGWWPVSSSARRDVLLLGAAAFARFSPLLLLASVAFPSEVSEGWPIWKMCAAWAGIGLAQAAVAEGAGRAAIRWGTWTIVVSTLVLLAGAYGVMAAQGGVAGIAAAIVAATISGGAEGLEKALVAERVDASERGTVFGFYTLVVAVAGLAGNAAYGATLARAAAWPWLAYWPPVAALVFAGLIALKWRRATSRRGTDVRA